MSSTQQALNISYLLVLLGYKTNAFKREMKDASNWIPLALLRSELHKVEAKLYPRQARLVVGLIQRQLVHLDSRYDRKCSLREVRKDIYYR